jgi:hypothetical protein
MSESKKYVISRPSETNVFDGMNMEFLYFEVSDSGKPFNFKWVERPSKAYKFKSMKDLTFFRKHRKINLESN